MPDLTWDSIADWYAKLVAEPSSPQRRALDAILDLLPPLDERTVLDIGCGEGLASRALAERGAHVIGVDITARLLDHARRQGPPDIEYRHTDAGTLEGLADATFAGAVANLSLSDIADLDAAMGSIARVLVPGGWLAFSIPHPCFQAPHAGWHDSARLVHGYFDEGFWRSSNPQGVRRVGNFHRTQEHYFQALYDHGFSVRALREPRAGADVLGGLHHAAGIPAFLVILAWVGQ